MKIVVRGFALTLVAAGMLATFHLHPTQASAEVSFKATTQHMPIPVCPPNDPDACHIEKW